MQAKQRKKTTVQRYLAELRTPTLRWARAIQAALKSPNTDIALSVRGRRAKVVRWPAGA